MAYRRALPSLIHSLNIESHPNDFFLGVKVHGIIGRDLDTPGCANLKLCRCESSRLIQLAFANYTTRLRVMIARSTKINVLDCCSK